MFTISISIITIITIIKIMFLDDIRACWLSRNLLGLVVTSGASRETEVLCFDLANMLVSPMRHAMLEMHAPCSQRDLYSKCDEQCV